MQVKPEIQGQGQYGDHPVNFDPYQQEVVMDLSKPGNKKVGQQFVVSESGALDLSAAKYKNAENYENKLSSVRAIKSRRSFEDDSDGEEGRLVIDDVVMEAQSKSLEMIGHDKEESLRQIPEHVKGENFLVDEAARKMIYQQLMKNKENGGTNFVNGEADIKEDAKLSKNNHVDSSNVSSLAFFPNISANNMAHLNMAQSLMAMNMGMFNLINPGKPKLDPFLNGKPQEIVSGGETYKEGDRHSNGALKHDNIGPIKRTSSNRRARIAAENGTSKKSVVEIYECKICNRTFSQVGNFHNHMKTHEQGEKICVCGICKMEFQDSYELQRHMRKTHTGDMPYKCEQCDREFSQYNNLRRHLRVHNGNMYKCQICGRTFNESFYLEMHLSSHTGERTYKCGICNFMCKENAELQVHIKSHRADELHTCDVCNKSFSKACVLRQHKKMHTGIRPFKCDDCGKAFIHRHHLTIHARMHNTDRPYTCKICGKEFAQTSHLYKHIRQHNEDSSNGIQVRALLEELQKEQHKNKKIDNSPSVSPQPEVADLIRNEQNENRRMDNSRSVSPQPESVEMIRYEQNKNKRMDNSHSVSPQPENVDMIRNEQNANKRMDNSVSVSPQPESVDMIRSVLSRTDTQKHKIESVNGMVPPTSHFENEYSERYVNSVDDRNEKSNSHSKIRDEGFKCEVRSDVHVSAAGQTVPNFNHITSKSDTEPESAPDSQSSKSTNHNPEVDDLSTSSSDSVMQEKMDSNSNYKPEREYAPIVQTNVHHQLSSSPELPTSTVFNQHLPVDRLPLLVNSNQCNSEVASSEKCFEVKSEFEQENHIEKNSVIETKDVKVNSQQVLVDKVLNNTQDDSQVELVTKENEKLNPPFSLKQTKENADIDGLIVAKLLQDNNNHGNGKQNVQKTEKKRRSAPTKRKQKAEIQNVNESLFRPGVPQVVTPEEQQLYFMQLQRMQAVQLAMMNPMMNLYHGNRTGYHGTPPGFPVSPSIQNSNRFDFEKFDHLRNSPSFYDKFRHDYGNDLTNGSQISAIEQIGNGVLDMSKENNKFWNRDLGQHRMNGYSPARFSSPSLSDDFSDGAIDMSSKRSQSGSVSSMLSEDIVESD